MGRKLKQRHSAQRYCEGENEAIQDTQLGDLFVLLYDVAEKLANDSNAPDFVKEIVKGS